MATIQSVKEKIQGLIDKANETTGGTSTDLTSAVDTLIENQGVEFDPCDGKERAINFFDIMGNLVYSYTRTKLRKLEELPPGPTIDGFDFAGWSCSLETLKAVQTFADVCPTYSKNGTTANILILEATANSVVYLNFHIQGTSSKLVVDWGDGSETISFTGSSSSSSYPKQANHTYTSSGIYYISLTPTGDVSLGAIGSQYYSITGTSSYSTSTMATATVSFDTYTLLAVNTPSIPVRMAHRLPGVKIIYASGYSSAYSHYFSRNPNLERIVSPNYEATMSSAGTSQTHFAYYCTRLKRIKTGTTLMLTNLFDKAYSLEELCMSRTNPNGSTTTTIQGFVRVKRVVVDDLVSKTINLSTSAVVEAEEIYVNDSRVDEYKANSTWSAYVDRIKPMSEYPDY